MKPRSVLFTLICGVFLQGCANTELPRPPDLSNLSMPFVHKIDIQQGNVVTQDMIAQLQYGMDKKKVNFIMGSPMILDTFHDDRWDYLYTISRGGERAKRRRVTLYFEDDLLVRAEGDIKPAAGRLVVDTRQDMTVEVPKAKPRGLVTKLAHAIPFVGEEEVRKKPGDTGRVVDEEEALPNARAQSDKPVLTPVQRAALEEKGGPGVMDKIKQALPFSGDEEPTATAARETTRPQAEESAESVADGDASPGLLAKLKGAMPFTGEATDAEDDEDEAALDEEEVLEEAETAEDGEAYDKESPEERPFASDDDSSPAARVRDDDDEAVAFVPPPIAPTNMPLDNQLVSEPGRRAQEDAEGVTVPRDAGPRKRGFFARLFGRDRDEDEDAPDARERRRYRDPSDPDAD